MPVHSNSRGWALAIRVQYRSSPVQHWTGSSRAGALCRTGWGGRRFESCPVRHTRRRTLQQVIKLRLHRTADGATTTVLMLALSRANIERLLAGNMAVIDGTDVSMPGLEIALVAGETEPDLLTEFERRGLIPPDQAEQMRAGFELMEQVPAARTFEMRYENPDRPTQ